MEKVRERVLPQWGWGEISLPQEPEGLGAAFQMH